MLIMLTLLFILPFTLQYFAARDAIPSSHYCRRARQPSPLSLRLFFFFRYHAAYASAVARLRDIAFSPTLLILRYAAVECHAAAAMFYYMIIYAIITRCRVIQRVLPMIHDLFHFRYADTPILPSLFHTAIC